MTDRRPEVTRTPDELDRYSGGTLVPTMGALHDGHAALIRAATRHDGPVIVSIFVNPSQFGPNEDFDRYPRDLERDCSIAGRAGADLIFAPEVETMYPPDIEIEVPRLPAVAMEPGLEDACRPGHFAGVCQVVARLFDLVRPALAIFGEKDFQQLQVLKAMVDAEQERLGRWPSLRIEGEPTIREPDGLAMSSRNRYLEGEDRDRALGLFRALRAAHATQRPGTAEFVMRAELEAHDLEVDYAVIRDATTLQPVDDFDRPTRGLIAARLGSVRLIDNMAMTVWR